VAYQLQQIPDLFLAFVVSARIAARKANLAPSVNPGLVLRDPCAEALEDREPWPCVGVSASSEEAWNPGSESRTGPLDLRVSPDFRAAVGVIS
jgi:hypothetical protein